MRITFTGTPPLGESILMPGRDAPRAFPLASIVDTFQASINNQSVSINIADIVHALMHYNTDTYLKEHDYSLTPSYQDQSQQYGDLFLANRSPLGLYGNSPDGCQQARGGFPFVVISNPVQVATPAVQLTSQIDIAFCEPIFLSPFYWGCSNEAGFYNVNTMDFNITFIGQANTRIWSHDDNGGTNVISSISYTLGGLAGGPSGSSFIGSGMPLMLFNYITPQETMVIPPNVPITYPYFDVLRYVSDQELVPSGDSAPLISNNIQLSSIPRRMYIFARRKNVNLYSSPTYTDAFMQISNLNIQFLNKSGLLASMAPQQIYSMCVKNHCDLSWQDWSGGPVYTNDLVTAINTIGSVICVEFATDIGLDSLMAPGILNQSMLQVTVQAKNIASDDFAPSLYIVAVLEGSFTIQGVGSASTNIGVLTPRDVLDCMQNGHVNYADVERVNGGDFWSGLKNFGAKLWPYLKQAHDYIKKHHLLSEGLEFVPHPAAQVAAKGAKFLGYGEGVTMGGRQMSRARMRKRLHHY
jgi:hypothetical protein